MWCFFDESYPNEGGVSAIIACLMRDSTIREVDRIMYQAQRKYFGVDQARNLVKELKGTQLFSKRSFDMLKKEGMSRNQLVAREILSECYKARVAHPVLVFGAAVYGAKDMLKRPDELAFPIVEILRRVSAAAEELEPDGTVSLVFDERLADRDVAINVRRFVSGVKLPNVSHYPLVGVSHVSPGVQLADIGAYILGRRAAGDQRFQRWLTELKRLEWRGLIDGFKRWGIQRWDAHADGHVTVRKRWN